MSDRCEIPLKNATSDEIRDILKSARRIAVVGHSDDPARDSYRVGRYLAAHGYEVFPVNPNARSTPELRFYADLASVPRPIDIVDIFRRPEMAMEAVEQAIFVGAKAVWMQIGVINEEAASKAEAAGLKVVMDRCPKIEIPRLGVQRIAQPV